jgi:O-antigen ligase
MQQTSMLAYKPRWFQNQKFIIGLIGTMIVWFILTSFLNLTGLLALVLGVQIVLFLFLFDRPVWAMASLIVGQFTTSNYMIMIGSTQISIRLLWTMLAFILIIPVLRSKGGIKVGSHSLPIIIPTVIFFALATAANAVNVDMSFTLQYLRTGVTSLAMIFFLPAVVNSQKDLKILTMVTLITCVVSAVFAIMQHYQVMGMSSISLYPTSIIRGRTIGLTEGPVHLGYDLSIIILPIIALLFFKGVGPSAKRFLPVLLVVIIIALYFSYTRSGLYSLAPGLVVMAFLMKGKMRNTAILISIVLIVAGFAYVQISGSRYSKGFGEDTSSTSRLALWQAGAKIAMDYPVFGIGQGRFEKVSLNYASGIHIDSMPEVVGILGQEQPHNDFLRVWLSFGTPALVVYLVIFFGIFRNFYRGYKDATKKFLRALSLGCFAALIAYIVNAAMHNLMDSVPLLWILAGLSIAVLKVAKEQKKAAENKALIPDSVESIPESK